MLRGLWWGSPSNAIFAPSRPVDTEMRFFARLRALVVFGSICAVSRASSQSGPSPGGTIERGDFRFAYDARGISLLAYAHDPFGATLTMSGAAAGRGGRGGASTPPTLALTVSYRAGADTAWTTIATRDGAWSAAPERGTVTYTNGADAPLRVTERYSTDGRALDWTIDLESTGDKRVHVGDVSIAIPVAGPTGENPQQIFERGFLRHKFVSGYGSFFFYTRASGAPPFLLVTVLPGTKLEYFGAAGGRGGEPLFIHSAKSGASETRGTWRQAHTALDLAPAGRTGSRASYGFRMRWANSYDELRALLYDASLFDVRVVPGMTVPENLSAKFSLHTKAKIESITAEFPSQTTIARAGEPQPGTRVYSVAFRKLGENMLTILHDGGHRTYLEFFVTEPLETLIKKRASFLVNRQQIRDTTKWWNGVYGIYDMKAKVTRTIDDPDIFVDRMVYALTCDDPGLSKAPFLAAKNATFPDRREIESLEYYLKDFVWGGLQRRNDEQPYPYGIYGTPDWYVNRDSARRRVYAEHLANGATALRDLGKEHVWRSYDYPHVVMLYFHMYQIAKRYPELSKYLDASGYLTRAWETARAFYTYPYEIYPSYYETYKWGLYNELVVLDLIDALRAEGFPERAAWLTAEWEKKVKYFVYDDQYPFRSEYAFDRTAFESSYAFAKYGATHDMKPDSNLWFDVKLQKWYSHPSVKREDSRAFMDRQLASGLVVRGWLNPAYYTLGADPGVSYMAAMGGWGVLDYALDFAPRPFDWLELGYASHLSSWSLMNTGRAETNYGFWFPGKENDGAAGWQFMSSKAGSAWMGSSYPGGVTVPRGPWYYDGEIDLGFGAALRMAATIVTRDPTFGWFAYGGLLKNSGDALEVTPRDGLRRRFDVVPDSVRRVKLELDRDGFASEQPIALDTAVNRIAFSVENRTGTAHATVLKLALPSNATYAVRQDGKPVMLRAARDWDYPWLVDLAMTKGSTKVQLLRQ